MGSWEPMVGPWPSASLSAARTDPLGSLVQILIASASVTGAFGWHPRSCVMFALFLCITLIAYYFCCRQSSILLQF